MKNYLILSALLGSVTFVGCSSAYRTAQTPDDVYFSEGPPQQEVASSKTKEQPEGYTSYWEKQDDNMLRMKVSDREKWSEVDDIDYWQGYNNNYWVNYNSAFNSPWAYNPYSWNSPFMMNRPWGGGQMGWGWNAGFGLNNWGFGFNSWNNNWSNPYCWNQPVKIINKYPVANRPTSSLAPYTNYSYNRGGTSSMKNRVNVNPGVSRSIWEGNGSLNQNDRSGNSMYRTITRPSGSGSNGSSYDRPARTFDSGGGNSGGSSGGSRSSGGTSGGSSSGSSRGGRGG